MQQDTMDRNLKIFSLNDLIELGLITEEHIRIYERRKEAKKFVEENFKGMF